MNIDIFYFFLGSTPAVVIDIQYKMTPIQDLIGKKFKPEDVCPPVMSVLPVKKHGSEVIHSCMTFNVASLSYLG